jgi:hypothetical protein
MATTVKAIAVHGAVTWVNPYKGGARPPPEIEAEARMTKLCTNQLLHARPAADVGFDLDSAAVELQTDAEGNFAATLAPGQYYVFRAAKFGKPAWHDEEQAGPKIPGGSMDAGANAAWRRRPDCVLEVLADEAEQHGVLLHWVNGSEAGLPLPC